MRVLTKFKFTRSIKKLKCHSSVTLLKRIFFLKSYPGRRLKEQFEHSLFQGHTYLFFNRWRTMLITKVCLVKFFQCFLFVKILVFVFIHSNTKRKVLTTRHISTKSILNLCQVKIIN
jgi:hypothetical protein